MIVIVKLVAMFMMLAGCVMLIKKDVLNQVMEYSKEGNRIYICSAIKILIGLCFWAVAAEASAPWILVIVGLLAVVSGAIVFVWKKEKSIEIINKVVGDAPEQRKRIIGAIPLLLGVILLLAI